MSNAGYNDRKCNDCGGYHFVTDYSAGDIVCSNCGLVSESRIMDERSEWRTFGDDDKVDPCRVGGPVNELLNGLSTVIGGPDSRMVRHNMCLNRSDRTDAFKIINQMSERLNLSSSLRDVVLRTFQEVMDAKVLRGKGPSSISAACFFVACRNEGKARCMREILNVLPNDASKKDVNACFKAIVDMYKKTSAGSKASHKVSKKKVPTVQNPADFIRRYCNELKLSLDTVKLCEQMVDGTNPEGGSSKYNEWDGKNPRSIAAAIIYICSMIVGYKKPEDFVHMQQIVLVTQAAEVTIRACYRLIYPKIQILLSLSQNTFVTEDALRSLPPPTTKQ
jgi:transcription initiation factor TFIIB